MWKIVKKAFSIAFAVLPLLCKLGCLVLDKAAGNPAGGRGGWRGAYERGRTDQLLEDIRG